MKEDEQPDIDIPRSFWGWFPEFLRLGSHRIRRQARRLVLPVVENLEQRRVVGVVHRHEVSGAYLRRVQGPTATE